MKDLKDMTIEELVDIYKKTKMNTEFLKPIKMLYEDNKKFLYEIALELGSRFNN